MLLVNLFKTITYPAKYFAEQYCTALNSHAMYYLALYRCPFYHDKHDGAKVHVPYSKVLQ